VGIRYFYDFKHDTLMVKFSSEIHDKTSYHIGGLFTDAAKLQDKMWTAKGVSEENLLQLQGSYHAKIRGSENKTIPDYILYKEQRALFFLMEISVSETFRKVFKKMVQSLINFGTATGGVIINMDEARKGYESL
jgi:hypothetical protein